MKTLRPRQPASRADSSRRARLARRSECLACRTLVAVARQRKGFDPDRCQLVFEHLDAADAVRTALGEALAEFELTELQFAVLVTLFALDPEPVTPADLADYSGVSRAAITEALFRLETIRLVARRRDTADRRVHHLHLTPAGRDTVNAALIRYLKTVNRVARYIETAAQPDLLSAYQRLQRGAGESAFLTSA